MRRARIKSPKEKPWDTTLWALYLGQWDAAIRRADKLMNRLGTSKARSWALQVIGVCKECKQLNLPGGGPSRKEFDPSNPPYYMQDLLEDIEIKLDPTILLPGGGQSTCAQIRDLKTYFYRPGHRTTSIYMGESTSWCFGSRSRPSLPSHQTLSAAVKAGFRFEMLYESDELMANDLSNWPWDPPVTHYRTCNFNRYPSDPSGYPYVLVARCSGPMFSKLHRYELPGVDVANPQGGHA